MHETRQKRPRKTSGGKFLLIVLLLAAGVAGYAFYTKQSPQQLYQRLVDFIGTLTKPEPAPTPAPTPEPTATPTPTPTPTPEPTATPAPTPNPLAWLLEHKEHWPKEVVINQPVKFPAVLDGKVVGSAEVPARTAVTVYAIEASDVAAVYNGGGARVPIDQTDLRERAMREMASADAAVKAAGETAPIAAMATPAVEPSASATLSATNGEEQTNETDDSVMTATSGTGGFVHPGLLHSEEDLKRMRTHRGRQPWKDGYEKLVSNSHSHLGYKPNPQEVINRGQGTGENYGILYRDIAAAYAHALRWRVSGESAYAKEGVEICNAWAYKLKQIGGSADRFLAAGIYGYEFANAGEILRTYRGWKKEDFEQFQKMMLTVFYPMNHDFLERHNGAAVDHYWCNWDSCNIASTLAIGVLCDKHSIYEEGIRYFKHGKGNGAIRNAVPYLHGDLGQFQESGRDQGHCTLCIALLGAVCQMAWTQGDDLFGFDDNRFFKGCEYVAKYNLGYDVPFHPYSNSSFHSETISEGSRGTGRPTWELVYNHYGVLKGLDAKYSKMFAEKLRPEGGGGDYGPNSGGYDQLGYGTLTMTLDPTELKTTKSSSSVFKSELPAISSKSQ